MKIAVYGAGSLGTIIGALLTKNGHDVELIDINAEHVKALNEKGAKIIGLMELIQPVKALVPDDLKEEYYDLVIYLTKSTQNKSSLQYVAKSLKPDGIVAVGQNGMPEDDVAEVVGKARVVGCIVAWGATWMEPGVSKLTTQSDHMLYHVGELDNQITERLKTLNSILNDAGECTMVTDLIGRRWGKMTANCCFSTMSAVVNGTYGDVMDNPKAIRCAAFINNESMAIAQAAGTVPSPTISEVNYLDLTFNTEQELEKSILGLKKLVAASRNIKTGMLYDIAAGRYPEIDSAFNGVLLKWGERYGVPTPVNQQVVKIVQDMAKGKLKPDASNVDLIELPNFALSSARQL